MKDIFLEKEAEILSLTDELAMMLWVADENKSFTWLNQSWFVFTGIASPGESQKNWFTYMHPEDVKSCLPLFEMAFEARKNFQFKCRLRDKNGVDQWMYIYGNPRIDNSGIFTGFAGVCLPIAAEQVPAANLENAFAEQQLALEKAEAALIENKNQQERHNSGLESFTYIASHDLQEPLRKIQSFSKLILNKDGATFSDTAKDYFSRITNAAERMQKLIDDLLSYSSTNVLADVFAPTDLNAVLEEALLNFQEIMAEKEIRIHAGPLPTLPAIQFQLVQLFTNILSNAIKFRKNDQPLVIQIEACTIDAQNIPVLAEDKAGNYYHISISDNGIGFEQVYNEKIFELFQRLHGKNEYAGTGIGLAICKKIVTNHKGYISATAVPGQGARFNIYLPA
jgi:signal transduction histidine kinase